MRSAVLTLGRRTSPLRFVLFPMLHVGERSFYDEVAERAARCALIVAEGGPSGSAPAQEQMARLRWDGLVDQLDALDLESLGVPVIFESERPERDRTGAERLLDTAVDSAAAVGLRLLGRHRDPRGIRGIDEADEHDDRWVQGRMARMLRKAVVDDRDERLVATLTQIHAERHGDPVDVAVVYGAAHMYAVVTALRDDLRYYVQNAEWLMVRNG
ncbi:hypothetical protein [Actinomadura rubrisoli]|uniref:TraB/GumN family protein n=1 Tax=Actinomadura rubrisoli TaxID=2530368 RepID=A0A4V2YXA6_9ACTN|nr:hypothetical protein [Actinomadura rubrisoli]TDD88187.1 hypothetical protein E1298_15395 [Actinomadura rubrisoli]